MSFTVLLGALVPGEFPSPTPRAGPRPENQRVWWAWPSSVSPGLPGGPRPPSKARVMLSRSLWAFRRHSNSS